MQTTKQADENIADDNYRSFKGYVRRSNSLNPDEMTNFSPFDLQLIWLGYNSSQPPVEGLRIKLSLVLSAELESWVWSLTLIVLETSLYTFCKQCRPRSEGAYRSSLIRGYTLCHIFMFLQEKHLYVKMN